MENFVLEFPHESFLDPSPRKLTAKMSGTTTPRDAPRQERSTTPSSSGSTQSQSWRSIMTGLQDAVQEYLKAPPASTLPHPAFPTAGLSMLSSSTQLEEGMHQMSEVIMGMSEMALSDQGSQEGPVRNAWKDLKRGGTTTTNHPWTEYWFNGEVCFVSGPLPYTDCSGITETGRQGLTQKSHWLHVGTPGRE